MGQQQLDNSDNQMYDITWIHSKMKLKNLKTSSNGNIFRVTAPLWGESTGHRWIPLTKASDVVLKYFFDLHLNKRLSN